MTFVSELDAALETPNRLDAMPPERERSLYAV